MKRRFAVFILSHGRAESMTSLAAIREHGYTGDAYILIDNEDKQKQKYLDLYGDSVIIFDKTEFAKNVDACDNYNRRNSVVYARNYNFIVAQKMGITHFLQLDDDYTRFQLSLDGEDKYITADNKVKNLDSVIHHCLDFLDNTRFRSVAFAQSGDFIGGAGGAQSGDSYSQILRLRRQGKIYRKAMNSFFFRTDRPVTFRGRVNDDVNLYVECGRRGDLFGTIPHIRLSQPLTQVNAGGCTDIYREMGTYIKSFYSVMVAPSCVRIAFMGFKNKRIHHNVVWKHACPVILDEKYRKARTA